MCICSPAEGRSGPQHVRQVRTASFCRALLIHSSAALSTLLSKRRASQEPVRQPLELMDRTNGLHYKIIV